MRSSLRVAFSMLLAINVLAQKCPSLHEGECHPMLGAFHTLNNMTDATACCFACNEEASCVSWTLNKILHKCFLHAAYDQPSTGDCTSGEVRDPPPSPSPSPAPMGAKNVLLIIVDDLRPEISALGQKGIISPNIDALVNDSVVFERAYCQQAICAPTRNSFLSGRRPQRTQAWNFRDSFREIGPDWASLPGYFKDNGYLTLGTGKTFHPGLPPNWDGAKSWSQERPYVFAKNAYPRCKQWPGSLVCPNSDDLDTFSDYIDLQATIANLHYARNESRKARERGMSRPFFLAYGIHRPHLPWNIPKRFWDMYPETEKIALPTHQVAPDGMPPIAFTYECDGKTDLVAFDKQVPIPFPDKDTPPPNVTRSLRKGYYSAVTFTDFLIGQMLKELDTLGHREDTVVALIGDHGWQLGEHNIWGKHTNFELGTRVPLLFRAPGYTPRRTSALAESVDLYPTLASLAGLPAPPDVDGIDLSVLFDDNSISLKEAVFSEYPRCPQDVSKPWGDTTSCVTTDREKFTVMGYSVRTDQWRYTEWLWWDAQTLQGDFSQDPVGVELYSHAGDDGRKFDAFENRNLAESKQYARTVAKLHAIALKQWNRSERSFQKASPRPQSSVHPALQFEQWNELIV